MTASVLKQDSKTHERYKKRMIYFQKSETRMTASVLINLEQDQNTCPF